jgi:hypothetical protein
MTSNQTLITSTKTYLLRNCLEPNCDQTATAPFTHDHGGSAMYLHRPILKDAQCLTRILLSAHSFEYSILKHLHTLGPRAFWMIQPYYLWNLKHILGQSHSSDPGHHLYLSTSQNTTALESNRGACRQIRHSWHIKAVGILICVPSYKAFNRVLKRRVPGTVFV